MIAPGPGSVSFRWVTPHLLALGLFGLIVKWLEARTV